MYFTTSSHTQGRGNIFIFPGSGQEADYRIDLSKSEPNPLTYTPYISNIIIQYTPISGNFIQHDHIFHAVLPELHVLHHYMKRGDVVGSPVHRGKYEGGERRVDFVVLLDFATLYIKPIEYIKPNTPFQFINFNYFTNSLAIISPVYIL